MIAHFILYVRDQERSRAFYEGLLLQAPRLHVPGMTEFALSETGILGLMPERGIKKLLGDRLPDPALAAGAPRAELYLRVEDVEAFYARALALGSRDLSAPSPRDWGDVVGYVLDPDGHVLAFAKPR